MGVVFMKRGTFFAERVCPNHTLMFEPKVSRGTSDPLPAHIYWFSLGTIRQYFSDLIQLEIIAVSQHVWNVGILTGRTENEQYDVCVLMVLFPKHGKAVYYFAKSGSLGGRFNRKDVCDIIERVIGVWFWPNVFRVFAVGVIQVMYHAAQNGCQSWSTINITSDARLVDVFTNRRGEKNRRIWKYKQRLR